MERYGVVTLIKMAQQPLEIQLNNNEGDLMFIPSSLFASPTFLNQETSDTLLSPKEVEKSLSEEFSPSCIYTLRSPTKIGHSQCFGIDTSLTVFYADERDPLSTIITIPVEQHPINRPILVTLFGAAIQVTDDQGALIDSEQR